MACKYVVHAVFSQECVLVFLRTFSALIYWKCFFFQLILNIFQLLQKTIIETLTFQIFLEPTSTRQCEQLPAQEINGLPLTGFEPMWLVILRLFVVSSVSGSLKYYNVTMMISGFQKTKIFRISAVWILHFCGVFQFTLVHLSDNFVTQVEICGHISSYSST